MQPAGLIIGLGNHGDKYRLTRHNMGFMLVDRLFQRAGARAEILTPPRGLKNKLILMRLVLGDESWLAAKPQTYMNLSGEAAGPLVRYYDIPVEKVLAVHDELDLPLGRMKIRFGGGAAGHKGILSLKQHLGTPDFFRLRLGIGKPLVGETSNWVLSRFSPAEMTVVDELLDAAEQGLDLFVRQGLEAAMRVVNGYSSATLSHD